MEEQWKDIPGFENRYQASTEGNIRNKETKRVLRPKKIMKGIGYYLRVEILGRDYYVHYLVCTTFPEICGERFDGAEIDHRNQQKADNRAENLHWVTHSQNMRNTSRKETPYPVEQVKDGSVIATYYSVLVASKNTKTKMATILRCCRENMADKNGYFWRYAT